MVTQMTFSGSALFKPEWKKLWIKRTHKITNQNCQCLQCQTGNGLFSIQHLSSCCDQLDAAQRLHVRGCLCFHRQRNYSKLLETLPLFVHKKENNIRMFPSKSWHVVAAQGKHILVFFVLYVMLFSIMIIDILYKNST